MANPKNNSMDLVFQAVSNMLKICVEQSFSLIPKDFRKENFVTPLQVYARRHFSFQQKLKLIALKDNLASKDENNQLSLFNSGFSSIRKPAQENTFNLSTNL